MLSPKNYVCSSISDLINVLWLKNGSLHVGIKTSVKYFVIRRNLHVKSNFHQNRWMLQSKKVISAKISSPKSLSFCTDKAVSIKSAFLPENALAIFKIR